MKEIAYKPDRNYPFTLQAASLDTAIQANAGSESTGEVEVYPEYVDGLRDL